MDFLMFDFKPEYFVLCTQCISETHSGQSSMGTVPFFKTHCTFMLSSLPNTCKTLHTKKQPLGVSTENILIERDGSLAVS